jgi:hypothetical protein
MLYPHTLPQEVEQPGGSITKALTESEKAPLQYQK